MMMERQSNQAISFASFSLLFKIANQLPLMDSMARIISL